MEIMFLGQMTLNGGWRDMALNTQREYNNVVDLNSGYRNRSATPR